MLLMVMDHTGWEYKDIYSKSRLGELIYRRGLIDYIAMNNGETLVNCAKKTNRDHTTVLNSVKKFEERVETEGYVRQAFSEIINFCRENYYLYKGKELSG